MFCGRSTCTDKQKRADFRHTGHILLGSCVSREQMRGAPWLWGFGRESFLLSALWIPILSIQWMMYV